MADHDCPDDGTRMEPTGHVTSFQGDGFKLADRGGLLGKLGLGTRSVQAYVCPECGLVRLYAEGLEE